MEQHVPALERRREEQTSRSWPLPTVRGVPQTALVLPGRERLVLEAQQHRETAVLRQSSLLSSRAWRLDRLVSVVSHLDCHREFRALAPPDEAPRAVR